MLASCSKDEKKKKEGTFKKKISSLFAKKIDTEYTDSSNVEKFISENPDFKSYRKKIHKFYSRRKYRLAWSEEGEFLPQADMFINLLNNVPSHGIKHEKTYQLKDLYQETSEARKPDREEVAALRKKIDLLLTASYFQYAQQLWRGTVDPEDSNIEWYVERKKVKYGKTLDAILSKTDSQNPFLDFEPLHPEYHKLKALLAEYKSIEDQGGWPEIKWEEKEKLKKGDTSSKVILLKKRLYISKDLKELNSDSIFDSKLEEAVKKFQRRHGLEVDGVVAFKTSKVLNVPIRERIEQVIVNMERWRWVPKKISDNYVFVNIPEFKLHVYENGKEIWDMNVIVGKQATRTPIFNDEIEFIVMSPTWNVPKSIAVNEIIPLVQKDSAYLEKFDMEVLERNKPVDPTSIPWASLSEKEREKYTFRQKPGGANALGKVKFLFPNEFDVYLHDTPTGHLFSQAERDFSHGCIRIEKPLKFAEYLLRNDPNWNREKIIKAMNSGEEQFVKLKNKLPVYIVYFTTWVDEFGTANFREDLYGHDKKLEKAYFEK